ncbi:hypothetical protein CHS0354_008882 [Potamilus streckersoni]|uniref:Protein DD3-3 n=1 Tax=Potamilus streckersoni TaxID=2493646 RepID=A0AAE0W9M3_9BIVA|nr:hypothetical protein CHS0354_008882 [Potamilus streckersoni]
MCQSKGRDCSLILLVFLLPLVTSDLYVHNPRGSNNRLNENTATRTNPNRLFDSQNNDRGGYNVGDATDVAAGNDANKQYQMKYFQSGSGLPGDESYLDIEWTNQHGCGGNEDTSPQKQNCIMILQFMCQDGHVSVPDTDKLRDGVATNTQDYIRPGSLAENEDQKLSRKTNSVKPDRGLQELWEWYDKCNLRERNKGLFTADQKLTTNNGLGYSSAIYTRQNPQGTMRGYECPEERDYYPYWHPTLWKDISILAENRTMCSYHQSNSFNTQPYHECVEMYNPGGKRKHWSRWNNQKDCTNNGGKWVQFSNYLEKAPDYVSEATCVGTRNGMRYIWAIPYDAEDVEKKECLVALEKPDCQEAPWSRSNHLGDGNDGKNLNYRWRLPYFPSVHVQRCVFRMRYNISTDDYDPYHTDSSYNKAGNVKSPVQNNPEIDVGGPSNLQLALNTNQIGRVFQDRSHVFLLRPRHQNIKNGRLFNLNVRGKRGNIVQVYPAVEYDFTPNNLEITEKDMVHIQWTGSNTHNNNAPGGDGDIGDAGEGAEGTDRSNLVQLRRLNDNFPLPFESTTMWNNAEAMWVPYSAPGITAEEVALNMASSGYYRCMTTSRCTEKDNLDYIVETRTKLQNQLNNAPASYEGAVLRFRKGIYNYMCTRNNNFSNRSQKGTITVQ